MVLVTAKLPVYPFKFTEYGEDFFSQLFTNESPSLIFEHQNTTGHTTSGQLQDNRQGGAKYGQGHKKQYILELTTYPE